MSLRHDAIPKVFHFVFGLKPQTEPFHLTHYLCLESCRRVNAPDRIVFHHDAEPFGPYWELIKPHLVLNRVQAVSHVRDLRYERAAVGRLYSYAHHSDFIRLEQLLAHGGVYADIDTLFVNPIPDALWTKDFVLGREDPVTDERTGVLRPSICNAFIMARAGAEFGTRWLREMPAALDGARWSNHSCNLANELWEQHPASVHVEPAVTFYKHMWTREGLSTLLEGLDRDVEGVVSMHLWSHLWWSRWRRDYSGFHAGRLTEEFIRTVDTTYNVVARQYLPAIGSIGAFAHGRAMLRGLAATARTALSRRSARP